jgi:hypothetical protein
MQTMQICAEIIPYNKNVIGEDKEIYKAYRSVWITLFVSDE